jgi:transcriptional regulator with XRE-family HTH domain
MITGEQVRAARKLLGWSQLDLTYRAHIPETSLSRFEKSGRPPAEKRLEAIKQTIEAAGVEFIDGEPGAVLKAKPAVTCATWAPPPKRLITNPYS